MLYQNQNHWLVVNPHLFGEASIWTSVTLKLFIIEVTFSFKILGFRFSPLDFQLAMDMSSQDGRYCSSVGYFQEVFDVRLDVSSSVYECQTGFIGLLRDGGDGTDCWWRTYSPYLPIWEYSLYDAGDRVDDYVSWRCTDNSQLDTETGPQRTHPHGYEPSNAPQDGGADNSDGDGIIDEWDTNGTVIIGS